MILGEYPRCIVTFVQPGCGHCHEFEPLFREAASRHPGVPSVVVDASRNDRIAESYRIEATPTVLVLVGGRTVARKDGAPDEDELEGYYQRLGG